MIKNILIAIGVLTGIWFLAHIVVALQIFFMFANGGG